MRKIIEINKVEDSIEITLDNGGRGVFYPFGLAIYCTVSEDLNKKTVGEFKRDIKVFNWDLEKLKQKYEYKN